MITVQNGTLTFNLLKFGWLSRGLLATLPCKIALAKYQSFAIVSTGQDLAVHDKLNYIHL